MCILFVVADTQFKLLLKYLKTLLGEKIKKDIAKSRVSQTAYQLPTYFVMQVVKGSSLKTYFPCPERPANLANSAGALIMRRTRATQKENAKCRWI